MRKHWRKSKKRQIQFFISLSPIHHQLGNLSQFYLKCVTQYSGVIYGPHVHLFQKLGYLGATRASIGKKAKNAKFSFFHQFVPKYITRRVIWVNFHFKCVTQYSGVIQKPHYHLFQKSGHLGATRACIGKKAKTAKFSFFFSVVPKYLTNWEMKAN